MKKTDVLDLLFMPKEEFQKLDGEFIDQLPAKQIARIPFCLWDTMTKEQVKHLSNSVLSTLDYDELVKLYIKFSDETEPYTIDYKLKDKTVKIESKSLEEKLYDLMLQGKIYSNFKARNRLNRKDCNDGIIFNNVDHLYNYLPKPIKNYISWDEKREHIVTAKRYKNPSFKRETNCYFKFDEIIELLKTARRNGDYILNEDEIPPLLPFTTLMSRFNVKYTLTSQFHNRWKIPYYLLFCGREFNDSSEGTRYYDIVECKPILEKILQIEYSPIKVFKYRDTNIIPKYCLEKIYPFLDIEALIETEKIDLYRGIENLLDYNSVIDYIQTTKINKTKKKPRDLPTLINFDKYFEGLDLPKELLLELKDTLDTYEINDTLYLQFPLERKHKMGGPYDTFRLKIISIIKEYVVYKSKLNEVKNKYDEMNKIPDIFVECLTSELVIDHPELKDAYLSNVQEFYPVQRLDGLGYGDIGYMDYKKVKEYFNF